MIKTNQFNDAVAGLTIFVEEKNNNGDMMNIFIRDESKILKSIDNVKDTENITIFAKSGSGNLLRAEIFRKKFSLCVFFVS